MRDITEKYDIINSIVKKEIPRRISVKTRRMLRKCLIVLLCIAAAAGIIGAAQFYHRSDPKNLKQFDTSNPFITGTTTISAHRSGAGDFPEETLAAFRGCVESPGLHVTYFEFDLHMTADNILVLSHDDTLDRVSDAVFVFGEKDIQVREKTLEELKQLNMAAQFVNDAGEMPYAELHGSSVPDELRILSLDEVLDYLTSAGEFRYIIEIKDGGDTGLAAADQLYATLKERGLLNRVIIGTFRDEVANYITKNYPDTHRSASPAEVVQFYLAALTDKKDFTCSYDVLQLPFNNAGSSFSINLGLVKIINYAHAHDLAMQYWTVNSEEDMEYLISIGADALITDYPDRAAAIISRHL